MELTKLKAFLNGKLDDLNKLPGFNKGSLGESRIDYSMDKYTYDVDTSILPKPGSFDISGAKAGILKMLNEIPNIPHQDTSTVSKKLNTANIQNAALAAYGSISSIANSWTNSNSENEILAQYHPEQRQVAGLSYDILSKAKDGKLPKFAGGSIGNIAGATGGGAAAGSIFGPVGAGIGGALGFVTSAVGEIVSSNKQAERERRVAKYIGERNMAERGGALGQAMLSFNAKLYGDQQNQYLYGIYKDGKLPKYHEGLVSGEANAKVSNGEFIAREVIPGQFIGYRVPGPKNNKDGRLAHLEPEDYVISNKNGSSDIAASGDIIGAINHMIATGNPSYKCGKLPGHAEGWLGNAIPSFFGTIASLGLYLDAKNSKPYYPRTYSSNRYETEALNTLAGLSVNPYPIMNQLRSAEARSNRAIDIAGGLSGGLRTAARLANLNTTQNNISNLLSNIQQQNNAYRSKYAEAALQAGQQARTARMAANQWDLDMYAKAHAARNRGIQTGIANMLSQIQQYQANEFKRRQFNDTMALYRADQKQRKEQFDWIRNTLANLPYYSLYDNIYGNPIKDNDVIEFDPYGARAYRKRNGLSIGG